MKKFLALILAVLMLALAFTACTPTTEDTPVETDDPNKVVLFKKGETSDYLVIYADNSSKTVIGAAKGIAYQLNQKLGIDLDNAINCYAEQVEWGSPYKSNHEILIGDTTREESAETKKLLQGATNEYALKLFDNGKIAIVASNDDMMVAGINYLINTYIKEAGDTIAFEKGLEYYYKDTTNNWKLSLPAYEGGSIGKNVYQIGYTGSFSAQSNGGRMQTIAGTNATQFAEYIDTLKANGYTQVSKTNIEKNEYLQLVKKNGNSRSLVYTYYLDNFKEVRVIEDYASTIETDFEYSYTPKAGDTAAVYMYGMMYEANGAGGTITPSKPYENNGATYIIRLSDNSLILIDGGRPNQASDEATEGFMNFLHEITGVDKNGTEKIRIAAVFFSHGDGDHFNFIYSILRNQEYVDRLEIERIMHNMGPYGYDKDFPTMGKLLYEKFPNIKFAKLHTGQSIQLADATIDVLYTHEDMVNASTGSLAFTADGNMLSTWFKLTVNGKSFLHMGDWGANTGDKPEYQNKYEISEAKILGMYKAADGTYPMLESDILQVAHHAINDKNANIHAAVKADYAFFSQQDVAYDDLAHGCYKNIVNQLRAAGMEDQHMYFAGRQTNWLTIAQDGTITHGHKKIEGVDEERYWYITSAGLVIYVGFDGKYNTSGIGVPVADTEGALLEVLEAAGYTGVAKVKMLGYWDYLDEKSGDPFWPANNT